ncbi:hypothetical protein [Achromobacter xylosoxidans]|uniref:DUF2783 domain-containing protein n=1 Tax=Alcaligenes xylosoxydans xylosoxydans TaxID=85698 RepID=A0A424WE66_ALCXX|nr:hypothetical protein [Achromobacter xylosoxidans]MBC9906107.1 hypothetical protein [Achromobacter xylosoxidans]MBD0869923.1 hypothetical protein [Achromobacter xylosoxidans]QNP85099.1 hypothetical protein IAG39_26830 [Achromobacter xylosoxidans]RPJ91542.1 hypothetical protein DY367_12420 [Achromobacter xylosoxidans]
MNNDELDQIYTAMAQTLTRVGEEQASLFLSILSLSLLARLSDTRDAATLLAQAEAACLANSPVAHYSASEPARPT